MAVELGPLVLLVLLACLVVGTIVVAAIAVVTYRPPDAEDMWQRDDTSGPDEE